MQASTFWKLVTMDTTDFVAELTGMLDAAGIAYAVIGGQAVNAYVEPLVSLDLDLVVATDDLPRAEALLAARFRVERFAHSINISQAGSDVRVQLQTDPRYTAFVGRAKRSTVLGRLLPVAELHDVLQGKLWAAQDAERRPSKRAKDRLDILRLIEAFPDLARDVPPDLLARLG